MKKGQYISYGLLSFMIGLIVIPAGFQWLEISFSFADVLTAIFGEPNSMNLPIVILLGGILLFYAGRSFYKGYKHLDE